MSGNRSVGQRARHLATLCFGILATTACFATNPASAGDCPGNPDALGTSRTLVVDPREHKRIGTMQYAETLPLQDHEVVLTFDDGPIPRNSDQVLAILAAQCVKATFFVVGRMAQEHPQGVRKLRDAGHTIGTHSQNHPLSMNRMSVEQAKQEVDAGIASVTAALGDAKALAPFFRIPGLLRAEAVEDYLASQGIQTWSADFPADDWRHISSAQVYSLAMSRLEAKGKGILLLHDIQARTVGALPHILQELKARGYRIVQVVPATPERPATPTEPGQWRLHPITETVATSHWPKIPNFVFANAEMLPGPALSDSDVHDGQLLVLAARRPRLARGAVPLPQAAPWPRQRLLQAPAATLDMPVPARDVFQIPERVHAELKAVTLLPRRAAEIATPPTAADATARLNGIDGGGLRRRPVRPSEMTSQSRRTEPLPQ
ncbi:peptidoglycan/xylan/chitin deacetylase (PgdA/CDA1 family) [Rhodopseudomonas rhenobacensis]|uniref:Chitooligosaccharide deacetylase n=1 Tax=Rhodopseudomonas rhenobacensis TaxID=87461 RepID=A0A7W7Z397_9BRAD|nr:polysaccharide deacetylase family protein [Rhodopseudomonas rhenobacensis]MBB5047144.1 peptidoglycan/xylan/chitin deacetylase (PgdA/CDA1 family) [Rhodopseudomonas rhenobacensis]